MTNKIIVSLMITMQLTVCMEEGQIVVYRPVDPQDQAPRALHVADLLLPITVSLQTLGRLRSTCHLFSNLINFSKENPTFNPGALGASLAKNFNIATEALISCAHAQKRDVFKSIFYNGTRTEQHIRKDNIKLLIPHVLYYPFMLTHNLMEGYKGQRSSAHFHYEMLTDSQAIESCKMQNRQSDHEVVTQALASNNYIVIQILHAARKIDMKEPQYLFKAAECGSLDVVKMLLDKGADINAKYIGSTPLTAACYHHKINVLQYLLEQGATIDNNCLINACNAVNKEIVALLLQYGAPVDGYPGCYIPLIVLCNKTFINTNDIEFFKYLLNAGANSNIQDTNGDTPLMCACDNKKACFAHLLLEKGANCLIKNNKGNTALHIACMKTDSFIIGMIFSKFNNDKEYLQRNCTQLFLLHNKDLIDVQNNAGETSLHVAAKQGQTKQVQILLENGANVNLQDIEGNTPLHIANNHQAVVALLLQYGADLNIKNTYGQTPFLLYVFYAKNLDIVKLLLNHPKCDLNAVDIYGNTALHYAINYYNDSEMSELLLNKGCNVNAQNHAGETPLHYVAQKKRSDYNERFCELLLSHQTDQMIRDNEVKLPSDYSTSPVLRKAYKNSLFSLRWQRLAICAIASALGFLGYTVIKR